MSIISTHATGSRLFPILSMAAILCYALLVHVDRQRHWRSNHLKKDSEHLHEHLRHHEQSASSSKVCDSSTFVNVSVPLFIKWEDFDTNPRDFYIIQLGGNDGLNIKGGDPVWEYVRPCGWSGAILEPQPEVHKQLAANYADVPNIKTFNMAVSNESSYGRIIGTGRVAKIEMIGKDIHDEPLAGSPQGVRIPVVNLQKLWHILKPKRVDALVVDVEGLEELVLSHQNIPHPKPRFILFEIAHLATHSREAIDKALVRQGYSHRTDLKHFDEIAVKYNMPPQDRLYSLTPN